MTTPTVFGRRMKRTVQGGWFGHIDELIAYEIAPGTHVAGGGIIWESSVGCEEFQQQPSLEAAAKDIERKLLSLYRQLGTMIVTKGDS